MTKIIEDLIFKGHAQQKFSKLDGKLNFTLKTLTGKEQINLEKDMRDVTGTAKEVLHTYSVMLISYALVEYQGEDYSKMPVEERYEIISNFSTIVLDLILDENQAFNEKCKKLLRSEEILKKSKTPSTEKKSNSSTEE
jgi:archaellin